MFLWVDKSTYIPVVYHLLYYLILNNNMKGSCIINGQVNYDGKWRWARDQNAKDSGKHL